MFTTMISTRLLPSRSPYEERARRCRHYATTRGDIPPVTVQRRKQAARHVLRHNWFEIASVVVHQQSPGAHAARRGRARRCCTAAMPFNVVERRECQSRVHESIMKTDTREKTAHTICALLLLLLTKYAPNDVQRWRHVRAANELVVRLRRRAQTRYSRMWRAQAEGVGSTEGVAVCVSR